MHVDMISNVIIWVQIRFFFIHLIWWNQKILWNSNETHEIKEMAKDEKKIDLLKAWNYNCCYCNT
jgi:hypothetical protein